MFLSIFWEAILRAPKGLQFCGFARKGAFAQAIPSEAMQALSPEGFPRSGLSRKRRKASLLMYAASKMPNASFVFRARRLLSSSRMTSKGRAGDRAASSRRAQPRTVSTDAAQMRRWCADFVGRYHDFSPSTLVSLEDSALRRQIFPGRQSTAHVWKQSLLASATLPAAAALSTETIVTTSETSSHPLI